MSEQAAELPSFVGEPRNGQWTKFKLPAEAAAAIKKHDAHVTKDGYFVGVYVRGGIDALGNPHVTRVEPVDVNGEQVRYLSDDKKDILVASVNPLSPELIEFHPLTSRDDVPAPRLAKMDPEWQPKP